jgi:indole-3-glycerol phosphate synthase
VEHPVLRKDFVVDPIQVLEARAAGADSVLLITSCLGDAELGELLEQARALGMEPLVETHADRDMDRALATDALIVGVNARDLESLEVDVDATIRRLGRIDETRVGVAESGLRTRADVERVVEAGASAILVGEALMRAADPARAIAALIHGEEHR